MACAVADHLGLDKSLIRKVSEADFSQPAKRPLFTGLNIDKARKKLRYQPISFKEGLQKTLDD
jgi:dTDP-4-dehydrorhamnose reductase